MRRPPADMAVETAKYSFNFAIRGYHIYRQVLTPCHGQRLVGEREHSNAEDRFVVTVFEHDGSPYGPSSSLGIVRNRSIFVSNTGGKPLYILEHYTCVI